ncbi:MAG: formylglycine-generating enzyme family protein [bacterium]
MTTAGAQMQRIPGGAFRPLYNDGAQSDNATDTIDVTPFYLDAETVTNAEFLAFARAHPKWRKSRIKALFADRNYFRHWRDDSTLGDGAPRSAPVVNVSWFAAKAYCRARRAALPTAAQWEYAAAASETDADASDDPAFIARLLAWYSRPRGHQDGVGRFRNVHGVYDLHGSVWEWVLDFNSALSSGESRADSARDRQLYCAAGVVGASTYVDYPSFLRYGYRSSLDGRYTHSELGFRCAAAQVES